MVIRLHRQAARLVSVKAVSTSHFSDWTAQGGTLKGTRKEYTPFAWAWAPPPYGARQAATATSASHPLQATCTLTHPPFPSRAPLPAASGCLLGSRTRRSATRAVPRPAAPPVQTAPSSCLRPPSSASQPTSTAPWRARLPPAPERMRTAAACRTVYGAGPPFRLGSQCS